MEGATIHRQALIPSKFNPGPLFKVPTLRHSHGQDAQPSGSSRSVCCATLGEPWCSEWHLMPLMAGSSLGLAIPCGILPLQGCLVRFIAF